MNMNMKYEIWIEDGEEELNMNFHTTWYHISAQIIRQGTSAARMLLVMSDVSTEQKRYNSGRYNCRQHICMYIYERTWTWVKQKWCCLYGLYGLLRVVGCFRCFLCWYEFGNIDYLCPALLNYETKLSKMLARSAYCVYLIHTLVYLAVTVVYLEIYSMIFGTGEGTEVGRIVGGFIFVNVSTHVILWPLSYGLLPVLLSRWLRFLFRS